jgi:predicted small metal-binding protein
MARKKRNCPYGIDCGFFAVAYSSALLRNIKYRVCDLPSLVTNAAFNKLNAQQKSEVINTIYYTAKQLYYEAGFAKEIVDNIFENIRPTQE